MYKFTTPHTCSLCQVRHEIQTPYTEEEFHRCHRDWREGNLIQTAFPQLTSDQREMLMSGMCQEAWDAIFAEPVESEVEDDS